MTPTRHPFAAQDKVAVSWSGGKDACLAWLRARDQGLQATTFVTMCEAPDTGDDGATLSHHLPRAWMQRQVAACGAHWWPVDVPRTGPTAYGDAFADTLRRLQQTGHAGMVFGDIDLEAHRVWLAAQCEAAGLRAHFPLWGLARADVAREIVDRGLRATLVSVDLSQLDASFCGRDYDAALLADLPPGVCPCGEDGEFHTAVRAAPGMAALDWPVLRQEVVASRPPLRPTRFARLVLEPT